MRRHRPSGDHFTPFKKLLLSGCEEGKVDEGDGDGVDDGDKSELNANRFFSNTDIMANSRAYVCNFYLFSLSLSLLGRIVRPQRQNYNIIVPPSCD